MRAKVGAFFTALLLSSVLIGQQNKQAEIDLQAAIRTQNVKGDLKAAIKQYEAIVSKYSKDRAVAAQALLHMAECYDKLGDAESRKIYERVVRDFSNQTEAVIEARRRLASLNKPESRNMLTTRLLCSDCGDSEATLSADGRFMAQRATEHGDVVIRDLFTGQVRRLLADRDAKDPLEYNEWATVSPDSRQVLFLWFNHKYEPGTKWEVRLMANEPGSKARLVMSVGPEIRWISPGPWSADGKSVLVTLQRQDQTWQMAWLSLDGRMNVLKSLGWRIKGKEGLIGLPRPALSPDGRYIAYSALATNPSSASAPPSPESHIYLLAADGSGPEVELVKSANINESPVWTPDGEHILFVSNQGGSYGLWSIAVRNRRAAGSPQLLRRDTGRIFAIGMTPSGSYYYVVASSPAVLTSEVQLPRQILISDFSGGKPQSGTSRVPQTLTGQHATWSPDGKSIAFLRPNGPTQDLVLYSVETGEEKAYRAQGQAILPRPFVWFHDSSAVLQLVRRNGSLSLDRVDLNSGEFKPLLPMSVTSRPPSLLLSPDDKTLYMPVQDVGRRGPNAIVSINLASGERKQIFTVPEPLSLFELALSPDGTTLALVSAEQNPQIGVRAQLELIAADGSNYRKLYGPLDSTPKLAWTPDGRELIFAKSADKTDNVRTYRRSTWQIMRIPVVSNTATFTGLEVPNLGTFSLSPDGSRIVYDATKTISELLALDNVPSVVNASR